VEINLEDIKLEKKILESVKQTVPYPRITLLIPALNEEKNLPHVLPKIPLMVDQVLLVDGLSTDRTNELAKELYPDIKIVKQDGRGKGNAVQAGIKNATGDIVVMIDADGSMNPQEIPLLVEAIENGADFVKGSRFIKGGGTTDMGPSRQVANKFFVLLVNTLFGGKYTDLCYGYCAFRLDAIRKMDIKSNGFEVETEINVKALKSGLKIIEVPSFEKKRIYGVGKLRSFPDGWRIFKTILRLRFSKNS
jgi:glycosyltransferase involved in cell wall biosynthesis